MSLEVCSIHPDLKEAIRKFRFRKHKNNAAILRNERTEGIECSHSLRGLTYLYIVDQKGWVSASLVHLLRSTKELVDKVMAEEQHVVIESELDVDDVEDLKSNITDTQPRFVLLSWTINHKDGRISYPLAFIFFTPRDCKPQLQMMYAGTYKHLIEECKLTKVFQIRDIEELDEDWIDTNLAK